MFHVKQSFERKKTEIFDQKRSCDRKKAHGIREKEHNRTKFTLRKKAKVLLGKHRSFPHSTRISRSFLFQFGRKCGIIIEWPRDKFRLSGWGLSASLCRAVTPTHGKPRALAKASSRSDAYFCRPRPENYASAARSFAASLRRTVTPTHGKPRALANASSRSEA